MPGPGRRRPPLRVLILSLLPAILAGALLMRCGRRDAAAAGLERRVPCMVWEATRGQATVWLCGSLPLLREEDFPPPQPYLRAFAEAKTLLLEVPPGSTSDPAAQEDLHRSGRLPPGQNLEGTLPPDIWSSLAAWSARTGPGTAALQSMKPWYAALTVSVTTAERMGFRVSRSLENEFALRAGTTRKVRSLSTLEQQWTALNALDSRTQEQMLEQALAGELQAERRTKTMAAAWREGDRQRFTAILQESMEPFPELKKALLDGPIPGWVNAIEEALAGDETVMVITSTARLASPGGILDQLEKRGVTLTQKEYRTRRPAAE